MKRITYTNSHLNSQEKNYSSHRTEMQSNSDKYNNFHDGVVTLSLPITPVKYITITPLLTYVFPLCDDAKNEMKGRGLQGTSTPAERDSSFLYSGVTFDLSYHFAPQVTSHPSPCHIDRREKS